MIPALILFIIHAHADYLLQSFQHGWKSWLDLSARAPKWGFFDFIPHDPWHIVQTIRNNSVLVAAILAMSADQFWIIPNWVMVFALYAIGRGIGFSAFVKWMAKR